MWHRLPVDPARSLPTPSQDPARQMFSPERDHRLGGSVPPTRRPRRGNGVHNSRSHRPSAPTRAAPLGVGDVSERAYESREDCRRTWKQCRRANDRWGHARGSACTQSPLDVAGIIAALLAIRVFLPVSSALSGVDGLNPRSRTALRRQRAAPPQLLMRAADGRGASCTCGGGSQ